MTPMLLHEAVREARKAAGLSQKRLAELAGIQRRQLATLESGGNVTLNTIRKVIAQLPNLQTFTIDGMKVIADPTPRLVPDELMKLTIVQLAIIVERLAKIMRDGRLPAYEDLELFKEEANQILAEARWGVREEEGEGEEPSEEDVAAG